MYWSISVCSYEIPFECFNEFCVVFVRVVVKYSVFTSPRCNVYYENLLKSYYY